MLGSIYSTAEYGQTRDLSNPFFFQIMFLVHYTMMQISYVLLSGQISYIPRALYLLITSLIISYF